MVIPFQSEAVNYAGLIASSVGEEVDGIHTSKIGILAIYALKE